MLKIGLTILVMSISLMGQYSSSYVKPLTFIPQGVVLDQIGRSGLTSMLGSQSSGNPAELTDYQSFTFSLSVQIESGIDTAWLAGIGQNRRLNDMLQSAFVVFPTKFINFGLGITTRYSSNLDFGKIAFTTADETDGLGEYIAPIIAANIRATVIQLGVPFGRLRSREGRSSFGLSVISNKLQAIEDYHHLGEYKTTAKAVTAIGGGVSIALSPLIKIQGRLSLNYDPGVKITGEQVFLDSSETESSFLYSVEASLPEMLSLRLSLVLNPKLELTSYTRWIDLSRISERYGIDSERIVNLRFLFPNARWLSIGLLTTDVHMVASEQANYWSFEDDFFRARFLTLGGGFTIDQWSVEIIAASSYFLSGAGREQAILKMSVGYQF